MTRVRPMRPLSVLGAGAAKTIQARFRPPGGIVIGRAAVDSRSAVGEPHPDPRAGRKMIGSVGDVLTPRRASPTSTDCATLPLLRHSTTTTIREPTVG